jgi:splicing factor 1
MTDVFIQGEEFRNQETRGREIQRRKRKSRWQLHDTNFASSLAAVPKYLPANLTIEMQECLATRVRIEELTRKICTLDVDMDFYKEREPSPEPIYDNHGKRINTRELRARDKLIEERQHWVEQAFAMNPSFKPPADYTASPVKKCRKIYIPQDEYPEYNFIGLILGPRGNTQKRMEREFGCKIVIRGRGSIKGGKKPNQVPNPADDESLHVLVMADNDVQLERVCRMINELLVPVDETKNELKRQQLQELAVINGTLRTTMFQTAGESIQTWERAQVRCEICGDASHPTSDCTFKAGDIPLPDNKKEALISEYEKFLAEIGGADTKREDIYDRFLQTLSGPQEEKSEPMPAPPWAQGTTAAPWQQPAAAAPWNYPQGSYPNPTYSLPWQPNQQQ